MKSIEKLYDAFGELIYVIAMADGEIQKEELKAIKQTFLANSMRQSQFQKNRES